jgi:hypothetical protein
MAIQAIQQRRPEHFTPEETERAKDAYELCAKMGHPGLKSLQLSLDGPTHLTSQVVRNGHALFGRCLEAKMKRLREESPVTKPASSIGECVYVDNIPYTGCKTIPAIGGFIGAMKRVALSTYKAYSRRVKYSRL